jgi:hypothetical protein
VQVSGEVHVTLTEHVPGQTGIPHSNSSATQAAGNCLAAAYPKKASVPLSSMHFQSLLSVNQTRFPSQMEVRSLEIQRSSEWSFLTCPVVETRQQSLKSMLSTAAQQVADLTVSLPPFSDNFGVRKLVPNICCTGSTLCDQLHQYCNSKGLLVWLACLQR